MADCPSDITIRERRSREIMLYRTKGFMGEPAVSPTYCPINGAYSFSYSVNDGTENSLECGASQRGNSEIREVQSEISDCPYGFRLNLKFKGCSFGNMDMSFHCLGDWEGSEKGQRYIALMDTQATVAPSRNERQDQYVEESIRPRYRCALYTEDDETGEIRLALSSDSTCANHLRSPTDGYETLTLNPIPLGPWPAHIMKRPHRTGRGSRADTTECALPDWAQGKWEHIHVVGGTVLLKDHRDFKTYTARCVGRTSMRRGRQQQPTEERYLMYARTQCGDEHYKCVWLKHRGYNALEFQLGLYTSQTHNESLCDPENFQERTWTTQGRAVVEEPTPYPIIGEYTGVIPDTDTPMCAKLYSDCNNPEIMFYTIFNCFNRSEVFEEREYRCLGQWTEDGMIYTYTERRDMIGHECFVGVLTAKGDIYLLEAGQNCERGHEPMKFGMRLTQVSKCYGSHHPKLKTWQQQLRHLEQGHSTTKKPAWASESSDVYIDQSHRKAQALPTSWRERELLNNNYIYSTGSPKVHASNLIVIILSIVTILSPLSSIIFQNTAIYSQGGYGQYIRTLR